MDIAHSLSWSLPFSAVLKPTPTSSGHPIRRKEQSPPDKFGYNFNFCDVDNGGSSVFGWKMDLPPT
ncbi:hypothetical protein PM082_008285 [Marasmius tenuissimus]|nr:hypothetical protein PM082_008285 [Marasmius tenuissimus]